MDVIRAVSVLSALWTTASSKRLQLAWTRQSISFFNEKNPLVVKVGDILDFSCPHSSPSNIYVTNQRSHFLSCNCSDAIACYNAVPLCKDGILANSVVIWADSSQTKAVYEYYAGETYYFADFPLGKNYGGRCLSKRKKKGLKFVLKVEDQRYVGGRHLKKRSIEEKDFNDRAIFTTAMPRHSVGDILHNFGITNFVVIIIIAVLTILTLFLFIFTLTVLIIWGRNKRRQHCQ